MNKARPSGAFFDEAQTKKKEAAQHSNTQPPRIPLNHTISSRNWGTLYKILIIFGKVA